MKRILSIRKKTMKRFLSIMLSLLMLTTVAFAVPVTSNAATIIDKVEVIDIDEPFAGDTPDFTGSVVGEGYLIYYISYYDITEGSFLEEDGSEPFIHNHEYRVDVVLQYESGYEFKTEGNLPAVTGKLMGWTVKASKVEGTVAWAEIRLSHEFTAYKEIKEVKVTDIDEPYAGMTPDYTGSVVGEGYKILYIDYYDKTDGRFLKEENNEHFVHGHTYEMQVVLQYENGYEFATNEDGSSALTGVLIGYGCKPSKMDGTVAWAEVIMRKSFSASKIIRDVSASGVDEAVAGKAPDFEVVAGSDEYEVIDVSYYDITSGKSLEKGDGKVFECGHEYRLDITLSANSSYEFAVDGQLPAVTGTINGNTADVEKVYNTTAFAEVILRRTFIAPHDYHTFYVSATPKAEGRIDVICGACEKTESAPIPKISGIKLSKTSYTYDGKAKKPLVSVVDAEGNALLEGSDYKVTYASGRKNVGKYKVTVKFMDKYDGTLSKTFVINPKSTKLSKVTGAKKKMTVKWKKQTTQTTGYQIQYGTKSSFKGAKTTTITKNKTASKTISKLKAKTKYYVRIRTYKTVSGKKYYSTWSAKKSVKTK